MTRHTILHMTDLTPNQQAVLRVLRATGPCTDEQLVAQYPIWSQALINESLPQQTPSGIRTRRSELFDLGFVEHADYHSFTKTGRKASVWYVVEDE